MATRHARWVPLSLPRRFITDLVERARQVPLTTIVRHMALAPVVSARRAAVARPGWCALFVKAYALAARRLPELRRCYVPWPYPHLYEHPLNVASVAVERRVLDEDAVFFVHVRAPEEQTLWQLEHYLRKCKERPLEESALFRRILKTSRWPWWARWGIWYYIQTFCGYDRARHLGTFGVSVVSGFGAVSPVLLTPITSALNYGVIDAEGHVDVHLTFDHRVLTPGNAARALAEVEKLLCEEVCQELRLTCGAESASAASEDAA